MVSLYRRFVFSVRHGFSDRMRARRTARFVQALNLTGGERVIDLGGAPGIWRAMKPALKIVMVNLPGAITPDPHSHHDITYVEGDACNLPDYPDGSFDIAFSNSVIEHVGGPENRAALAREARRLAPRFWVQTPSIWFPMEAHTYLPFWWFYPPFVKRAFIRRWRRTLPAWCEMIEGTTVLPKAEVRALFPDAEIWTERLLGIPKSYMAMQLELDRNPAGAARLKGQE